MAFSIQLFAGGAFFLTAACIPCLVNPARAEVVQQTVTLMKIDQATLATGYKSTKIVGSQVQNEAKDIIGTIDDLIITPTDQVPFAVLSVGGFLGLGTHYVVVPANQLSVVDNHMLLRGATKESLGALPPYQYSF